jgi:hypothetical protein
MTALDFLAAVIAIALIFYIRYLMATCPEHELPKSDTDHFYNVN